ncbi:hypothetical protein PPL_09360 [Heterostelium album PN500]|uniref:Uncharacterized protein n=1 Tax=Heterostelium pallidum (strain ATCC 26659 / Pp 5 / PN500) TaxID=670386 RepID=D3BLC7_HETP5|nr:hypothetical protein PPL_09360 [Heterostelium album PN500]EFA77861.1 hypothetical protein PPL_09360 [Heterostelium album PN500]|eukprot:XP_020429989.1 hypothetical protein PPL_09360 [Heterostelium album PN500]
MPETHITTQQLSKALYGINKDDINEDYINYIEALEYRIESLDDFMSSEAISTSPRSGGNSLFHNQT